MASNISNNTETELNHSKLEIIKSRRKNIEFQRINESIRIWYQHQHNPNNIVGSSPDRIKPKTIKLAFIKIQLSLLVYYKADLIPHHFIEN